jgi:hypothetical protein
VGGDGTSDGGGRASRARGVDVAGAVESETRRDVGTGD